MSFPNAFVGVKKIYTAEILGLIAGIVGFVGAIVALTGVGLGEAGSVNAAGGLILGAGVFAIATGVLSLISFIMNIIGVNAASKDEIAFKKAMTFIMAGIIASLVSSIFSNVTFITVLASAVSRACEILVTLFCVAGIRNLAARLGDDAVIIKSHGLFRIYACIYGASVICVLFSAIFGGTSVVANIMDMFSDILSIVAYVVYLSLLKRAKVMLLR